MEEKVNTNKIKESNIKPVLSIFIILMVILLGYYFLWKSLTIKTRNILINVLKDYTTITKDDIKISGFPFNKKIKFNLKIDNGEYSFIKNKVIEMNNIIISSFIFSNNMKIDFDNIIYKMYENSEVTDIYTLTFKNKPNVNIDFYSNGKLKSFTYLDEGYKIVDQKNEIHNLTKSSKINISSVLESDTINYTITSNIIDTQNIDYTTTNNNVKIEKKYNFYLDSFYTITTDEGEFDNSILKINNITIANDEKSILNITGNILKDTSDKYSYGNLKVVLDDYKESYENVKKQTLSILREKEDKEYFQIGEKLFKTFERMAKKNKETTDNKAVFDISREKNYFDYIINDESFLKVFQDIVL